MTHISEQIAAELAAQGFETNDSGQFVKPVATGGAYGKSVVILEIDDSGRWLDRRDGWGKIEKEVDLRDFPHNPAVAVQRVLAA